MSEDGSLENVKKIINKYSSKKKINSDSDLDEKSSSKIDILKECYKKLGYVKYEDVKDNEEAKKVLLDISVHLNTLLESDEGCIFYTTIRLAVIGVSVIAAFVAGYYLK